MNLFHLKENKCDLNVIFSFIFIVLSLFSALGLLYYKYCCINLSECWKEYVKLSSQYKWHHQLDELATKCVEEDLLKELNEHLNEKLSDIFSNIVVNFNKKIKEIELICTILKLTECSNEIRVLKIYLNNIRSLI